MDKDQTAPEKPVTPAAAEGAPSDTAAGYIAAIQKLKETTVPKAEAEAEIARLKGENKQLITALANGQGNPNGEDDKRNSDYYAAELCKPHTNLDYARISLKHREKCLAEGKDDPYIPSGANFTQGTDKDAEIAQNTADFLQSAVEDSKGDPAAFNAFLQARMRDDPAVVAAIAARKAKEARRNH